MVSENYLNLINALEILSKDQKEFDNLNDIMGIYSFDKIYLRSSDSHHYYYLMALYKNSDSQWSIVYEFVNAETNEVQKRNTELRNLHRTTFENLYKLVNKNANIRDILLDEIIKDLS